MKASQRRDDTGQPGAQRCPLSSQEWTFGNANKCPLWVKSGHVQCKLGMSALGQKRTPRSKTSSLFNQLVRAPG
jgi:hypothetical protein